MTRNLYAGLTSELEAEIRKGLHKARRKGKIGWGDARKKRIKHEYVVKPTIPGLTNDDEEVGRSLAYHTEMVDKMVARHEAGQSLWNDGPADTESFEGTELTVGERKLIVSVLNIRDAHLAKNEKKAS